MIRRKLQDFLRINDTAFTEFFLVSGKTGYFIFTVTDRVELSACQQPELRSLLRQSDGLIGTSKVRFSDLIQSCLFFASRSGFDRRIIAGQILPSSPASVKRHKNSR